MDTAPKIFVGGLSPESTEDSIAAYFNDFGHVVHVEVKKDQLSGLPRGFGFVTFDAQEGVDAAVATNGQHSCDGRNVEVKPAAAQGKGPPPKGGCKGVRVAPPMPAIGSGHMMGKGSPYGKGPSGGKGKEKNKGWGGGKPAPIGKGYGPAPSAKGYGPSSAPRVYGHSPVVVPSSKAPKEKGKGKAFDSGKGKPYADPWAKGGDPGKGKGGDAGKGGKTHDRDDAKIFVGGLPKTTGQDGIADYFSVFGPVSNVQLKMDPHTGESRGFCFVTFEEAESATLALGEPEHQIDGKFVEVKSAMANGQPAPGQKGGGGQAVEALKIFTGGIPKTTTEEGITAFFSQFGTVTEVLLKRDEQGESKGFAFVSFAEEAAVAHCLNNYDANEIDGKWVEVKAAAAKGDAGAKGVGKGGKDFGKSGKGYGPKGGGKGFGKGGGKGWAPY